MNNAIVLIHGFGFDPRTWQPLELAFDGFDVIRLSLPGFGSETPTAPYTIASLAAMYWNLIDINTHPTIHLAGHSMGGYVCIEMAAQHPERVASLALIHSHVFEDSGEKKVQRTASVEDIKKNGHSALAHKMIPSMFANATNYPLLVESLIERGMTYEDPAWYYGTQAMRDRSDHAETLGKLQVPVLMIAGKKDAAVPVDLIYKQASLAANNTLIIYDETGHMGMYENTAQMISDLIAYYRRMDN